jgi:hypothetical protein
MDATPASSSANGFDAALKALEDLETGAAPAREPAPAPAAAPAPEAPIISLSEVAEEDQPAAITASPFTEVEPQFHEPAPTPAQAAAEPAPTVAHPAPVPAPVAPAGVGKAGRIAIGLALFSSMVSAAGLIVAERTIMSAQLVVADARERAHQLEQANKLIRDLETVRDKQIELLQQQQLQLANAPVSSAELQHRMELLQAGLVQRDPMNRVIEAIQAGNSADAARFNEFGMKMQRIEAALGH